MTSGPRESLPSHPELLEWLAGELVRSGWRLRRVHELIVTSAAYRTDIRTRNAQAGPTLGSDVTAAPPWRRAQRLDAEALRDSLLAVSGVLRDQPGGPGFKPAIPAEATASRTADRYPSTTPDDAAVWRRSVYLFVKRSVRFPFTEAFDAPDPTASCGRRIRTTVPTQQLALLNDEFVRHRAEDFARRLERETGGTEAAIRRGFALALGRTPRDPELAAARDYLGRQSLTNFCHALFTLNEFIYVD